MSVPGTPVNNVLNPRARARARTLRRSSHPSPSFFAYIAAERTPRTDRILVFREAFSAIRSPLLYDRFDRPDVATPSAPLRSPSIPRPSANKQERSPRVQITIVRDDIHTLPCKREKHPFELSTARDTRLGKKKRNGVCRDSIGSDVSEFVSARALRSRINNKLTNRVHRDNVIGGIAGARKNETRAKRRERAIRGNTVHGGLRVGLIENTRLRTRTN